MVWVTAVGIVGCAVSCTIGCAIGGTIEGTVASSYCGGMIGGWRKVSRCVEYEIERSGDTWLV